MPPRSEMRTMGIYRRGLVWLLALTGASHTAAYHSVMDDFYYPPEEEGGEPRPPVTVSLPGAAGAMVQPTKLVVMLHGFSETGNSSRAMRIFLRNHAFLVRRPGTHAPPRFRLRFEPRLAAAGSDRSGLFALEPAVALSSSSHFYTSFAIPLAG